MVTGERKTRRQFGAEEKALAVKPGDCSEALRLAKPMRIEAVGGPVRIGVVAP